MQGLRAAVVVAILATACGAPGATGPSTPGSPKAEQPELAGTGWRRLPDSPLAARHGAMAVWVDGSLVVFGGRDTAPCPPNADCGLPEEPPLRDGARLDWQAGGWSSIAPLPTPVEYGSTVAIDGTVYLWSSAPATGQQSAVFMAYDVAADQWASLPIPDSQVGWAEVAAGHGEVLLVQGSHEQGRHPDLRYDPHQQTWTPLPRDPLGPSFDRDLTTVGDLLVLTAIDITESPGGADGPARYRAATWTEADGWQELHTGDVIGYDPNWIAVGDRLMNPTPGGTDGGEVNPYGRVLPHGGILDPHGGDWSTLPDAPVDHRSEGLVDSSLGDDRLLVSATGWALQPTTGSWHIPGTPDRGPDDGAATAVGDGRLYVFGGARWDATMSADLLQTAWVWAPPTDDKAPASR